ncbi:hypothetical protein D3C87_1430830 [compost metagenome]
MELQTDLWTNEVILEGQRLRLEPIGLEHIESLARHTVFDKQFVAEFGGCRNRADVEKEVRSCLARRAEQKENGFVMVDKESGEAVGYSNFLYMERTRRNLDIGRTRIGPKWHKSFVNTEAKLLMLEYAFETLKCIRVGFKVDSLNFNSQRAVKRIGGKFEGEVRNYLLLPDGRKRDFHSYSILDTEWPNVKTTLLGYLEKHNVSSHSL